MQTTTTETVLQKPVTIKDIVTPSKSSLCSAMASTFSVNGKQRSVSYPPILYYALLARQLAALGFKSESEAQEKGFDSQGYIQSLFRDFINKVFPINIGETVVLSPNQGLTEDSFVTEKKENEVIRQSEQFQILILNEILRDESLYNPNMAPLGYENINCSRAKLNTTQANFLLDRLSTYLGSHRAARKIMHECAFHVKKEMATVPPESPANNETLTRKLSNQLYWRIFILSGITMDYPNFMDIEMNRAYKKETEYHSGKMLV